MRAVIARIVTRDVDDGAIGAFCVVQIREAIGEPWAHMQQGRGWATGHPRVAIRGSGTDTLEQAQHRAEFWHRVELLDDLHLRRPGVGKDPVDAGGNQTSDKALGAVHVGLTFRFKRKTPSRFPAIRISGSFRWRCAGTHPPIRGAPAGMSSTYRTRAGVRPSHRR